MKTGLPKDACPKVRRVADSIMDELHRRGVGHVFTLSGGGIMYLVDALGRSALQPVCCHHEQAAGIAAQAYAMRNNTPGVCLATTGPGGTNALTACAAAYVDSTPVLFLSGQVKRADLASIRGVRQYGAQENDIVAMAAPVCKYAVMVEDPAMALYEVQKALHIACSGRQGPVWVDLPLDVQATELDDKAMLRFDPAKDAGSDTHAATGKATPKKSTPRVSLDEALEKTAALLAESRRPLLLIGHGIVAAKAEERVRALARRLRLPVQATWRGLGVFAGDDPLFFGSPGLQAVRSANMILQGADLLLVLGSRLDNMITAFAENRFGIRAKKIIVDVDEAELTKLDMPDMTPVVCDAGLFLERLDQFLPERPLCDTSAWIAFCNDLQQRFPLAEERQVLPQKGVDLYAFTTALAKACLPDDVIVVSSTSRCNTAGHMAFSFRQGQRPISSMGMGSMGFALPSALGAWFASGKQRVLMLEGDGSLQLNLQELQTIRHHNADVKMFIFSNRGYAAIATMQDRNFDGFHVGSDAQSGLTMPDLEKVAAAYSMPFVRISDNDGIDRGLAEALSRKGPLVCEIVGDMAFDEIPKCISSVNADGQRVSAALENPYPFLDDTVLESIYTQLP